MSQFIPSYLHQRTVYNWVIEDVANNLKEDFRNEGVDLQVLNELKQVAVCVQHAELGPCAEFSVDP